HHRPVETFRKAGDVKGKRLGGHDAELRAAAAGRRLDDAACAKVNPGTARFPEPASRRPVECGTPNQQWSRQMAVHEHETRIVEGDGSSGILAGIAVVALLFLAFILFFNW